MAEQKVLKKHGIEFIWTVRLSRQSENYENLDQHIRQCEHDRFAVTENPLDEEDIKLCEKILKEDPDTFLFVHDSQMMFYPIFCFVTDIATPEDHSLLNETVLAISGKFKNFKSKDIEKKFLKILYSKENTERVKKFKLRFESIGAYQY